MTSKKNNIIHILKTNPRFYIFYKCLEKYNLIKDINHNYTFLVPINFSFIKHFIDLDKQGDEKIKTILKNHIIIGNVKEFKVNNYYNTLNKSLKITKPYEINNNIFLKKNPIVETDGVIWLCNDIIID